MYSLEACCSSPVYVATINEIILLHSIRSGLSNICVPTEPTFPQIPLCSVLAENKHEAKKSIVYLQILFQLFVTTLSKCHISKSYKEKEKETEKEKERKKKEEEELRRRN